MMKIKNPNDYLDTSTNTNQYDIYSESFYNTGKPNRHKHKNKGFSDNQIRMQKIKRKKRDKR